MKIDTRLLQELGPVPFWRGERRCVDALEDIYARAAEAARRRIAASRTAEGGKDR